MRAYDYDMKHTFSFRTINWARAIGDHLSSGHTAACCQTISCYPSKDFHFRRCQTMPYAVDIYISRIGSLRGNDPQDLEGPPIKEDGGQTEDCPLAGLQEEQGM